MHISLILGHPHPLQTASAPESPLTMPAPANPKPIVHLDLSMLRPRFEPESPAFIGTPFPTSSAAMVPPRTNDDPEDETTRPKAATASTCKQTADTPDTSAAAGPTPLKMPSTHHTSRPAPTRAPTIRLADCNYCTTTPFLPRSRKPQPQTASSRAQIDALDHNLQEVGLQVTDFGAEIKCLLVKMARRKALWAKQEKLWDQLIVASRNRVHRRQQQQRDVFSRRAERVRKGQRRSASV